MAEVNKTDAWGIFSGGDLIFDTVRETREECVNDYKATLSAGDLYAWEVFKKQKGCGVRKLRIKPLIRTGFFNIGT
tara:strand:- start:171 stop:398 length:228 start_codon:yes stop_codon:yes gene_type:complete